MLAVNDVGKDEIQQIENWSDEFGQPVKVIKTLRNGLTITEWLPEFIAEIDIASIVYSQPDVLKAKIVR